MQIFPLSRVYNAHASYRSADGTLYLVSLVYPDCRYPGKTTSNGFEAIVLRTQDGATFERVFLEDSPKGHFHVAVEPAGMFLTYDNGGREVRRVQVPGFVTPGVTGDVTVVSQPAAPDPALLQRIAQLEQQVRALQNAPKPQAGVTQQQAEAIAWSKAGDRIYAELQQANSPLMSTLWQKALDAAFATLKQYGLV